MPLFLLKFRNGHHLAVFQVIPEGSKENQLVSIQSIGVDENFGSTFGLQLLEGRFFRNKIGGFVSGETVINESAMKSFGWQSADGKASTVFANGSGELTVVGVVKDFNLASLHEAIVSFVFYSCNG